MYDIVCVLFISYSRARYFGAPPENLKFQKDGQPLKLADVRAPNATNDECTKISTNKQANDD
jgi:hypothetical protein